MDLNKETAMRLWTKSFGKKTTVVDYSGRTIVKGAYNDRSSDYGWNVDHILPQRRGGKTVDYNLIVCHISTNDEKTDKFPVFKANGKRFEIIKVENHYEIRPVSKESIKKTINPEYDDTVNFLDSASGIRFFKRLKDIQNKPRFVGAVLIKLQNVQNTAVIDFIERFFDEENISYSMSSNYMNSITQIKAMNYNMPLKEDTSKLLDKCILLNTYIKYYFKPMGYVNSYSIGYKVVPFEEKQDMYLEAQNISFNNMPYQVDDALYITSMVYGNTDAKDREPDLMDGWLNIEFQKYDYCFSRLANNLKKEAGG